MLSETGSRRFSKAAVVLPVLLAITTALPDRLLNLVCRSGAVMDVETCCPSTAGPTERPAGEDVFRDEACCSLRAVDLDRALSEGPSPMRDGGREAVAALAVLPGDVPAPARAERLSPSRFVPPPSLGPPLILLKSSFLL